MATSGAIPSNGTYACLPLAVTIATAILAAPAAAAELSAGAARQGYYLAFGAGGALAYSRDHELGRHEPRGGVFAVRAGQMASERLGFGVQVDGGLLADERWRDTTTGLTLTGQLVLWRHLAAHAGVGLGVVQAEDRSGREKERKGAGPAYYTAALSYDFFPWYDAGSGGLALTPSLQLRHFPGDSFRSTIFSVGLEVVYWFGLHRRELDSPTDWGR